MNNKKITRMKILMKISTKIKRLSKPTSDDNINDVSNIRGNKNLHTRPKKKDESTKDVDDQKDPIHALADTNINAATVAAIQDIDRQLYKMEVLKKKLQSLIKKD